MDRIQSFLRQNATSRFQEQVASFTAIVPQTTSSGFRTSHMMAMPRQAFPRLLDESQSFRVAGLRLRRFLPQCGR